jgi:hypothetical protein
MKGNADNQGSFFPEEGQGLEKLVIRDMFGITSKQLALKEVKVQDLYDFWNGLHQIELSIGQYLNPGEAVAAYTAASRIKSGSTRQQALLKRFLAGIMPDFHSLYNTIDDFTQPNFSPAIDVIRTALIQDYMAEIKAGKVDTKHALLGIFNALRDEGYKSPGVRAIQHHAPNAYSTAPGAMQKRLEGLAEKYPDIANRFLASFALPRISSKAETDRYGLFEDPGRFAGKYTKDSYYRPIADALLVQSSEAAQRMRDLKH